MTKSDLLKALASLPDDSQVFVAPVPYGDKAIVRETIDREDVGFGCATIKDIPIYDDDGLDAPAFACIEWTY